MEYSFEIDTNSDDEYLSITPGVDRELDDELDLNGISYSDVSLRDYAPNLSPIEKAKVAAVENSREGRGTSPYNRHRAVKPLWLKATVYLRNLNTGEKSTDKRFTWLSELIRHRGIYVNRDGNDPKNDNCGHIIASSLGGKMVDFNLFPQNRSLNSGMKGNYVIWRLIEAAIAFWVTTIPQRYNPRAKFQMLLFYDDSRYPDRPDKFKYLVKFLMDPDSSDEEDEVNEKEYEIELSQVVMNVALMSLQCVNEELHTLKERIKAIAANLSRRCKEAVDKYLEKLADIIDEIPVPVPVSEPPKEPIKLKPYRDRGISVWDFVPIVGSIKTLKEGVEDLEDGNALGGCVNLGVGIGCLALDCVTLGSYGSAMTAFTKLASKEAAKQAGKEAGKMVVKETTKKLIQKAEQEAVKTVVTYGAAAALRSVASNKNK